MSVKRVFVLSRRSLFHQGIKTLLSQVAEMEIVGQDSEPKAAVACIQKLKPDVVILNLDDPEPDLSSPVLCVLRERAGIRIIGLSLKDNRICVFQGENKEIQRLDDLFNAILD
jgi:DNA-binding NarL/FixJ family response regulator